MREPMITVRSRGRWKYSAASAVMPAVARQEGRTWPPQCRSFLAALDGPTGNRTLTGGLKVFRAGLGSSLRSQEWPGNSSIRGSHPSPPLRVISACLADLSLTRELARWTVHLGARRTPRRTRSLGLRVPFTWTRRTVQLDGAHRSLWPCPLLPAPWSCRPVPRRGGDGDPVKWHDGDREFRGQVPAFRARVYASSGAVAPAGAIDRSRRSAGVTRCGRLTRW
jgi:hypothetical protein